MHRVSLWTLIAVLAVADTAIAHVPKVGGSDHAILEPERSWAFFESLPSGQSHTWTFELPLGAPLFLHVAVPLVSSWIPEARLEGPQGPIALTFTHQVEFEPFTPYASREMWSLDVPAPASGRYELVISGAGGPYVLGYGLVERFTPLEWVTIPLETVRLYRWAGESWALIALPYASGVIGALWVATGRATRPSLALVLAAGLFAGSALQRVGHLVSAYVAGADAAGWAWGVAGAFLLPSLALIVAAWRSRRTWALAMTGVAGLLVWSGLLVGPMLALTASVAHARSRGSKNTRRASRSRPRG